MVQASECSQSLEKILQIELLRNLDLIKLLDPQVNQMNMQDYLSLQKFNVEPRVPLHR